MDSHIYFVVFSTPVKITTKEVRSVVTVLDEIISEYNEDQPKQKRDWRTYEQQLSNRIRNAIRTLKPLIDEAIFNLKITKGETRGRKSKMRLDQKVELLFLKRLFEKSNREMSDMLVVFSLLSDIDVSYKTVERLYSDEQVFLVLLNIHALILKKNGVEKPNCTGDGTGYSLTIKKHYATEAQKLKDKKNDEPNKKKMKSRKIGRYIFSFRLMDLDTRLYIGYGTSHKSENEAYVKAMEMAKSVGMNSIRLDRYFSGQAYVKSIEELFGHDITIYVIPKKNATIKGSLKWKKILHNFVYDTKGFLGEYFKRNQSESGFSEDKRRFGWIIPQRREDRVDTCNFCTTLWHNMFWMNQN